MNDNNIEKGLHEPTWFYKWKCNHFYHLKLRVDLNTRLLWIILGAMIASIVTKGLSLW